MKLAHRRPVEAKYMKNNDVNRILADQPLTDPALMAIYLYARRHGYQTTACGNTVVIHTRDRRTEPGVQVQFEYFIDGQGRMCVAGRILRPRVPSHHISGIQESWHWRHRPELRGFQVDSDGCIRLRYLNPDELYPCNLRSFDRHFRSMIRLMSHVAWLCQITSVTPSSPENRRSGNRWRGMLLDRMMWELYKQRDRCLRLAQREEFRGLPAPTDQGWVGPGMD
jgi:hypothetical protein